MGCGHSVGRELPLRRTPPGVRAAASATSAVKSGIATPLLPEVRRQVNVDGRVILRVRAGAAVAAPAELLARLGGVCLVAMATTAAAMSANVANSAAVEAALLRERERADLETVEVDDSVVDCEDGSDGLRITAELDRA